VGEYIPTSLFFTASPIEYSQYKRPTQLSTYLLFGAKININAPKAKKNMHKNFRGGSFSMKNETA
jgi:hypothetical protein